MRNMRRAEAMKRVVEQAEIAFEREHAPRGLVDLSFFDQPA